MVRPRGDAIHPATSDDMRRLRHGLETIADIFFAGGAKRVFLPTERFTALESPKDVALVDARISHAARHSERVVASPRRKPDARTIPRSAWSTRASRSTGSTTVRVRRERLPDFARREPHEHGDGARATRPRRSSRAHERSRPHPPGAPRTSARGAAWLGVSVGRQRGASCILVDRAEALGPRASQCRDRATEHLAPHRRAFEEHRVRAPPRPCGRPQLRELRRSRADRRLRLVLAVHRSHEGGRGERPRPRASEVLRQLVGQLGRPPLEVAAHHGRSKSPRRDAPVATR